jgi:hypothetical protein
MDSRLDSLFRTTFQPAQQTDTWQGIRREEPQNEGRKKSPHKNSAEEETEEDYATLSVLALHEFLKNLLQQAGEQQSWTIAQTLPPEEDGRAATPLNTASASAARAYQATAKSAPGQSVDFSERISGAAPAATAPIKLSAEELRIIHQLLDDIEALGHRGITTIALHPAENFLQSLVIGVREAAA